MNISKARDFFSAYHEGTLDEGLKEAFERSMAADPTIAEEYASFVELMESLSEPSPEAPVPGDLHEKIMARLDRSAWEQKQKASSGWFGYWRPALIGGLAVTAIVAGILNLNNQNNGVAEAGLAGGIVVPTNSAELIHDEDGFRFDIKGSVGSHFLVRRVDTGEVLEDISLRRTHQSHEIANQSATAAPIEVVSPGGERYLVIVLPGTKHESAYSGEGSTLDVGRAIAGTFRMPVILRTPDSVRRFKWSFAKGDDFHVLSEKLKTNRANLSLRADGIVLLADF